MCCASPSTTAVLPTPGSPISTGLFFVRRERIWTTRWISFSRPITGSSVLLRAAAVRSKPSWSIVGVRLDWRAPAPAPAVCGPLCERMRGRLGAHALKVDAEAFEHAGGDALALAHQAEQQVFRADVVVC